MNGGKRNAVRLGVLVLNEEAGDLIGIAHRLFRVYG